MTIHLENGYYVTGKGDYVHREIAEFHYGKPLPKGSVVHHINEDPLDNRIENLYICKSSAEHRKIHAHLRIEKLGGDPEIHKVCSYHKEIHLKSEFAFNKSTHDGLRSYCKEADKEYWFSHKKKRGWLKILNQQYRRLFKRDENKEKLSWIE